MDLLGAIFMKKEYTLSLNNNRQLIDIEDFVFQK